VFRFDPGIDKEPYYKNYQVETSAGFSVLNALQYIAEHVDPTLSFYVSCRIGVCMGCLLKIGGKPKRSCSVMLTEDVVLEPLDRANVLKDLVMKPKKLVFSE
jgi:succinate dehydrogenase/fumarate reductase-like Fe-S protein